MRRLPPRMMPHRDLVSYRPKIGESACGPVYGPEVVAGRAAIDEKRKLVRSAEGKEVVSEARIALDLPDHVALVEGSLVTIWRGTARARTATVLATAVADWPRLPHFIEAYLE